ncbi:metallophosphoesterase [Spirochaetia bacterium]|nr:metallophosphoesterase [Spirochaetia bacterium]
MKILVVSDIHGNAAAFKAVLEKTRGDRERILCLGDLVGYGPDPNECVELAGEVCDRILGGNHDLGASGQIPTDTFSPHALKALKWTQKTLSPRNTAVLARLPPLAEDSGLLLSHGSPENPVWDYIFSEADALRAFSLSSFSRCFFGHTHVPSVFILDDTGEAQNRSPRECSILYGERGLTVETGREGRRILLNPGSVGFPRDAADAPSWDRLEHAVARYALFDTESGLWCFQGVEYDMGDTAKRMKKFGLWR